MKMHEIVYKNIQFTLLKAILYYGNSKEFADETIFLLLRTADNGHGKRAMTI